MDDDTVNEVAVFGGGCFWCTEAVFSRLRGVKFVLPGYAGGTTENPTYDQVSSGLTGHAEVTRIEYDPNEIGFNDLLTVFFATHDPTTMNRQGNDVGTQYRSMILYTTDEQRKWARAFIDEAERGGVMKIVTEVVPLDIFYLAEDYHRRYYERHGDATYCSIVVHPKIEKLERRFRSLLKKNL